ncbi:hypothetical protein GCM10027280_44800 [Micromonospora polyrhachis]|uniref:Uncharacterized protein n=1 Tax=Micromonospora polyrhachis TaxID=1282883 RepID=A0A7W7SRM3_9ACTN|nr:hypothetical protein [Micromonospora polyrhachis]MBB4959007.1 hypothetical protein [Micromonospora polyrhachis]
MGSSTPEPSKSLTDRTIDAYVRQLDPGRGIVGYDPIEFFGGDAATRACDEDGIPAQDRSAEWCNDMYIRNPVQETVEATLAAGATMTMYYSMAVSCAEQPCKLTLEQFAAEVAQRVAGDGPGLLAHIVIKDGAVLSIAHIYTP